MSLKLEQQQKHQKVTNNDKEAQISLLKKYENNKYSRIGLNHNYIHRIKNIINKIQELLRDCVTANML